MSRLLLATLAAILALAFARNVSAQNPPPPTTTEMVGKFVKADKLVIPQQGTFATFTMTPAAGGKPMVFIVQKLGDAKADEGLKTAMEKIKPGDLFVFKYFTMAKDLYGAQDVKPYTVKPGENEPNVYVFVRSGNMMAGNIAVPTVEATRFKKLTIFMIPMSKAGGKSTPDAKMTARIATFKPDSLIEIRASESVNPVIRSIRIWEPPTEADYGKVVRKGNDWALEVSDGPDTKTILIDKKDMGLLSKARLIKSGTPILYKADKDEKGQLWLADIRPRPKEYVTIQRDPVASDPASLPERFGEYRGAGKGKVPSGEQIDTLTIRVDGSNPGVIVDQVFMVSVKDAAAVMPKVAALKPGTPVAFKGISDNGAMWISDIRQCDATSQPAGSEAKATFVLSSKGKNNKTGQECDVVKVTTETGPNATTEQIFGVDPEYASTLLPKAAAIKAGAVVYYRVRVDQENVPWLISIREEEPTSAPAK